MEADIIKHLCPTAEIRRLQMNGLQFPIMKICDRIAPHVKMLYRKKLKKLIVIIDREQRLITSEEFEDAIRNEISSRGISCENIIITCPDRNFESWIVPFLNERCELTDDHQEYTEGKNGKAVIREKYKSIGRAYVETVDGVRLFKLINPHKLREISVSFGRFIELFEEECWWIKRYTGQLEHFR
ncbi:hypothetical protein [Shinella sp.]|uniref:hypothetical protein n=1 Tax=Shinella sp. TaxID=1870904 RepID=UPI003F720709